MDIMDRALSKLAEAGAAISRDEVRTAEKRLADAQQAVRAAEDARTKALAEWGLTSHASESTRMRAKAKVDEAAAKVQAALALVEERRQELVAAQALAEEPTRAAARAAEQRRQAMSTAEVESALERVSGDLQKATDETHNAFAQMRATEREGWHQTDEHAEAKQRLEAARKRRAALGVEHEALAALLVERRRQEALEHLPVVDHAGQLAAIGAQKQALLDQLEAAEAERKSLGKRLLELAEAVERGVKWAGGDVADLAEAEIDLRRQKDGVQAACNSIDEEIGSLRLQVDGLKDVERDLRKKVAEAAMLEALPGAIAAVRAAAAALEGIAAIEKSAGTVNATSATAAYRQLSGWLAAQRLARPHLFPKDAA